MRRRGWDIVYSALLEPQLPGSKISTLNFSSTFSNGLSCPWRLGYFAPLRDVFEPPNPRLFHGSGCKSIIGSVPHLLHLVLADALPLFLHLAAFHRAFYPQLKAHAF